MQFYSLMKGTYGWYKCKHLFMATCTCRVFFKMLNDSIYTSLYTPATVDLLLSLSCLSFFLQKLPLVLYTVSNCVLYCPLLLYWCCLNVYTYSHTPLSVLQFLCWYPFVLLENPIVQHCKIKSLHIYVHRVLQVPTFCALLCS